MNRKRMEDESFSDYKKRLRKENKELRQYLKGTVVWYPWQGTYTK